MKSPYQWRPGCEESVPSSWERPHPYAHPKSFAKGTECIYEPYSALGKHGSPYKAGFYVYSKSSYCESPHFGEPVSETRKPLRVIHIGQCLVRAGIETWLKSLGRYFDPNRAKLTRCVVTSDFTDLSMVPEMRVPVEFGGRESVRRAAQDCEVLLVSGPPETAEWLEDLRPPLCVFVAHGDGPWTRQILDLSREAFDHAVSVSQRVQSTICYDLPATVIYHGIDTTHIIRSRSRPEVRQACGFTDDDFVLAYVGRFAMEKNAQAVIDAVAQLPRQFKALLVGWGPMRQHLMEAANAMIPGRYAFVEGCDHMGDYYAAADAVCLPSFSEGFGLALLEAMLCERPIISGRAGFAPELLEDRIHGLIVDPDAACIARATSLLEQNPDWAASIARAGKNIAESFGFARQMACRYEDLFERLWREKFGKSWDATCSGS
jgi:glycosyltransferase involved in cell wall biosynthesis